jgi:NDP-sugar pyrophosphorylase family protein
MDAMILAAGLGTRLGPVGRDTPKALIDIGGATMLEHTARRLVDAGADRLIINAHHHADRIRQFVESTDLGAPTELSIEPERPLETGGGLYQAAPLLRRDRPFFLHNVDILSDTDLSGMYGQHERSGAIATLAVSERTSTRRLLFDETGLYGRVDDRRNLRIEVRQPTGDLRELGFGGIHVISPALLDLIEERGAFSILDPYLRLAGAGHVVAGWSIDGAMWIDIGTPERLEEARNRVRS